MGVLQANSLKGIWAVLQIPFNSDESIDYFRLKEVAGLLVQYAVHGIYSNGTAGEFYNQTETEFDKINELMAESCRRAGVPFQIGASHMSPTLSLERIRRARHLNPCAFQVILPDWLPLLPGEQIRFLERIADAAFPVPLVLYSPGHSKNRLAPADFKRLSEAIPPIIGIKTGAGNTDWYEAMRNQQTGLSVFVPGHRLATGFHEGVASGSYSNIACINPDAARHWYEIILKDPEEGLRIEKQVLDFFEEHIFPVARMGYSDPALDKLLAAAGGCIPVGTRLRWPHESVPADLVEKVRKGAKKMLPDFFYVKQT